MRSISVIAVLAATIAGAALAASAVPPETVVLDHAGGIPESLSFTRDGALIIGSNNRGVLLRAAPGAATARPWVTVAPVQPGAAVTVGGVLADDADGLVWICTSEALGGAPAQDRRAFLRRFDLKTGERRGLYPAPAGAGCNDVALDAGGNAYVTDTRNRRVLKLSAGAAALEPWAEDSRLDFVNGITFTDGKLYVGTTFQGGLFRIDVGADGKPGAVTQIATGRPLKIIDGMRGIGGGRILAAEMGADHVADGVQGKATLIRIRGDAATLEVLAGDYMGPSAITPAGAGYAYLLESKTQYRADPVLAGQDPGEIRAVRVRVPQP